MPKQTQVISLELVSFLAGFSRDPVGFVWAAFPWGEGALTGQQPQKRQLDIQSENRDELKNP